MKDEKTFIEIFENLEDPRDNRGKIYPLIDILLLALYGVLAGFSDFTNMSYYLKKREAELSEEFGLSKGVPSHDVFSDVFRVIDIEKFMALFVEWTKNLALAKTGQHIAIDGKAVRAAAKKAENGNIPYVLSAFMCGCGISIGQKEVGEKTNEIPEIPKLLDLIDITDCTVTIDAIGTQKDIMDKIIDKGGHFCLQLKKNQRAAFEDVDLFFRDLEEKNKEDFQKLSSYTETAKDHGRIEGREYYTFADTEEIKRMLGARWEHVKCIGMARLTRTIGEAATREVHYHLLDVETAAEKYMELAKGHWEIENSLHWVLDIHFQEDASTANSGNAISNLALLRKIAFNFTKLDPAMKKKTTKQKMIDFMTDIQFFKKLVFEIIPAK